MTISGVGDGVSVAVAVTVGVGLGRGVAVAVGVRVRVGVEVNGGPNTLPGPQEASRKVTMSNRRKFFLSMVELYSKPAGCVWDSFYLAGDGTETRQSHFHVKVIKPFSGIHTLRVYSGQFLRLYTLSGLHPSNTG